MQGGSAKPEKRRRKMKFGPFESSYEEEPQPLRKIDWCPSQPPFSNNASDYFSVGDEIPCLSLSRALRKGDILEIKVLSIVDPGSFFIKIAGPELLLLSESAKHLSRFTGQMTMFYEKFQREKFLELDQELVRGKPFYLLCFLIELN